MSKGGREIIIAGQTVAIIYILFSYNNVIT